jgi:hypothetical protein
VTEKELRAEIERLHRQIMTTTRPGESDRLIRRSHELERELREVVLTQD